MKPTFRGLSCAVLLVACSNSAQSRKQEGASAYVNVVITQTRTTTAKATANRVLDASNVAVWLTPTDRADANRSRPRSPGKPPQLLQRHKTFEPHVLIVPVGTTVEFPNKDPFFHNIFSLYDGKRFDLGLYEAGTTRSVLFGRSGVSFLFCNIHAEMSAVILSVETPYFGLSDRSGNVIISDIPDGRYQMNVWYERSLPQYRKELTRLVTISDSTRHLEPIRFPENPNFSLTHKNKYGLDYVPPPNSEYDHP
jgi:plastocyanin